VTYALRVLEVRFVQVRTQASQLGIVLRHTRIEHGKRDHKRADCQSPACALCMNSRVFECVRVVCVLGVMCTVCVGYDLRMALKLVQTETLCVTNVANVATNALVESVRVRV
jgi:hypothetical protein